MTPQKNLENPTSTGVAETKETLENNASILGNTVVLKGNDVVNLGSILGKDITLKAERDVIQQGLITGEDRAALAAGRDISMGNTILYGKNRISLTPPPVSR